MTWRHLDLFSGIGGFALAAREVWGNDYKTVAFCDNDWFCQQTLKKNFPGVPIYDDIRAVTNSISDRFQEATNKQEVERKGSGKLQIKQPRIMGKVNLLTGGFPCQPFSQAGLRKGEADNRYLWPEMFRVISEFQPDWVIGENVAGIINMVLGQVCADLESQNYEVQCFVIPAVAVNAPHRRDRVWVVANRKGAGTGSDKGRIWNKFIGKSGREKTDSHATYTTGKGLEGRKQSKRQGQHRQFSGIRSYQTRYSWHKNWLEVATRLCRVDDGLPKRVVRLPDGVISEARWRREALKCYGNAIVPQVVKEIMKGIYELRPS